MERMGCIKKIGFTTNSSNLGFASKYLRVIWDEIPSLALDLFGDHEESSEILSFLKIDATLCAHGEVFFITPVWDMA